MTRPLKLAEHPFCPQCGEVAPDDTYYTCIPCAKQGHYYRLIRDDSDRSASLTRWLSFWSDRGFSVEDIKDLPTYQNLTGYTFSKLTYAKSVGGTTEEIKRIYYDLSKGDKE